MKLKTQKIDNLRSSLDYTLMALFTVNDLDLQKIGNTSNALDGLSLINFLQKKL